MNGKKTKNTDFRNYLYIRQKILKMVENQRIKPSKYWQEELAGFDYLFNATPEIINRLRTHCYHITGLHDYEYRNHHSKRVGSFKKKFELLKSRDKKGLFIPESPKLGGFGFKIDNFLLNIDTLKFYECLITLDENGLLNKFRNNPNGVVLEIGPGWGGFAYQFKKLFPKVTYILVDLPQVFIFSATYLRSHFPNMEFEFIQNRTDLYKSFKKGSFLFIPNYLWNRVKLPPVDLAINLVSFQEMTTNQVNNYIRGCVSLRCQNIYSLNRDRSFYNNQLSSVSEILSKFYSVKNITPFGVDYSQLSTNPDIKWWIKAVKITLDYFIPERKDRIKNRYKHLLGCLPYSNNNAYVK